MQQNLQLLILPPTHSGQRRSAAGGEECLQGEGKVSLVQWRRLDQQGWRQEEEKMRKIQLCLFGGKGGGGVETQDSDWECIHVEMAFLNKPLLHLEASKYLLWFFLQVPSI